MADNNGRSFLEIEDELNEALGRIGETKNTKELFEIEDNADDKVAALTVQELLEQMKIDEFEKMYITTAAQSASPTNSEIPEDKMGEVKTLAEYELEHRDDGEIITKEEEERLQLASNYYIIPRTVNQRVNVGDVEQNKSIDLYTINDVEGNSLYTVIDNKDISMTTGFSERIKKYLKENYQAELSIGVLKIDDVIDHFTPRSMEDMYEMLGSANVLTMRFLPDRIDEYAETKGISKSLGSKQFGEREANLEGYDNLSEETQIDSKDDPSKDQELETDEGETLEEPEVEQGKVRDGAAIRLEEEEEPEEEYESYVEKIARLNHVKPAVVNTRVVENFEKVEEDTGIPLKGRYPRGEVIAVRIPYKLGYRTFLVEKSSGMTIDGKGRMDGRNGRLYDFDEIEDYFRYKIRDGHDGGESGKPLREDEGRDYTTYIDEHGDLKEQKFVNNGKKQDMLREERTRYLAEVAEADQALKEAIDDYQKHATQENYKKVREIIQRKVEIDNKYNALDQQREVTKETKENTERVIQRDLDDDDDDWFPGPGSRFHH